MEPIKRDVATLPGCLCSPASFTVTWRASRSPCSCSSGPQTTASCDHMPSTRSTASLARPSLLPAMKSCNPTPKSSRSRSCQKTTWEPCERLHTFIYLCLFCYSFCSAFSAFILKSLTPTKLWHTHLFLCSFLSACIYHFINEGRCFLGWGKSLSHPSVAVLPVSITLLHLKVKNLNLCLKNKYINT